MVRVRIKVTTQGKGTTRAWWARYPSIAETGEGSDRRVVVDGEPSWLPRIQAGEAWIDLPPGAVLRAGATHAGGYRVAKISTPPLIVEEGGEWVSEARDGSRWVTVTVVGARAATFDDLGASSAAHEPSPLAAYEDLILIKELERRGYVVTRAAEVGAQ